MVVAKFIAGRTDRPTEQLETRGNARHVTALQGRSATA